MKEKIKLSGVPETMLQTIYARAKESRGRGAIHDAKAEEIIGKLDYDFSLADKDTAMRSGVIARTIVLDKLTKSWLAAHSGAVVINIACGLDTRCYRMSGYAHWYNLDLQETMTVREKLLPESGTISQNCHVRHGRLGQQNQRAECTGADCHRGTDHVPERKRCAANFCSDFQPFFPSHYICGNHESYDSAALQGEIH